MKPKRYKKLLATTVCLCFFAGSWKAHGQNFSLQSGFVDWSPGANTALFSLTFDRIPDFVTTDQFGRQADSFQFFVGATPSDALGGTYASIIRGEEIHVASDIRIRERGPADSGDPNSGGWGSLRGSVPFTLSGQTLMFVAPLDQLNVVDGFGFRLELYEYGTWRQPAYFGAAGGPITAVPEPGVFLFLAAGGLSSVLLMRKRRFR